jgi:hypothetical protein
MEGWNMEEKEEKWKRGTLRVRLGELVCELMDNDFNTKEMTVKDIVETWAYERYHKAHVEKVKITALSENNIVLDVTMVWQDKEPRELTA